MYKNKTTQEKSFFLKNGAAVLEQSIRLFNGKCNPIRTYSSQQLKRATHNFDQSRLIHSGINYQLYRGDDEEEDREISVKVFFPRSNHERHLKMIANEVAVASKMSNHKNVLKLLGYCPHTELPMLVYELPVHGNLLHIVSADGEEAPFETKLRIGIGVANAVAYLHHGHSKTFINRDIRRGQVFLDQDYGAKLCSFYASIPIPEGETHVEADVFGTKGFTPPEVARYGRYTERSDVYDFGILLSELLTGKSWGQILWDNMIDLASRNDLNDTDYDEIMKRELDGMMLLEDEEIGGQLIECAKLVEKCINENVNERPNMVEVAKALILIKTNTTQ
ncbi:serine/threonine-protein kinase ZRK1-like [Humulus lupulus]|uniref:serine/threonine-protein kinase ZRK1-like n=1 Tax=Humulus lupulus TaxID=3486 RepID=UPI002B402B58|nr:serine/threonine-protein kinase ZRK1-like [Humulus lupulus]